MKKLQQPVIVAMPLSNREELSKQTIDSLRDSMKGIHYKLYAKDGMKAGEMKTLNQLVEKATKENPNWEWLVRSDDDLFYSPGWFETMLNAFADNPDVWLIGGSGYPTHEVLEQRDDILTMKIAAGCQWVLNRKTWKNHGPFFEDFIDGEPEDVRFCNKIRKAGGQVAVLRDKELVVHCGIIGTNSKGRSQQVNQYFQDLADAVGAKTNWK